VEPLAVKSVARLTLCGSLTERLRTSRTAQRSEGCNREEARCQPQGCGGSFRCTQTLDGSCLCWAVATCSTGDEPICETDADCEERFPGSKCGAITDCPTSPCGSPRACFRPCDAGLQQAPAQQQGVAPPTQGRAIRCSPAGPRRRTPRGGRGPRRVHHAVGPSPQDLASEEELRGAW
jgi:hypothetical protein